MKAMSDYTALRQRMVEEQIVDRGVASTSSISLICQDRLSVLCSVRSTGLGWCARDSNRVLAIIESSTVKSLIADR